MARSQINHIPDPDTPSVVVRTLPRRTVASGGVRARDRAIAAAANGIVLADPRQLDCPLIYANAAFLRMTGYAEEEVLGRNCRFLQGPDTDSAAVREMREALEQERVCQVLILNYRKDRSTFWNEVTLSPVRDAHGVLTHFIGVQADITARHEADLERLRLLAQERARAEREALLGRIGQTIRTADSPNQVLELAVEGLGQALGTDRCYYAAYDQNLDIATVRPEWHRAGLPPITGQYPMSRFAANRDPEYRSGRTQVVNDTRGDAATLELGLRSLVRVPLVSGASMTALCVAMVDGPREWTPAEASLVEAVATQTQSALEAVRVREREHRIAEQLQTALQPLTPASVPGMSLTSYYRPAWEEAGVGGDFSDVFRGGDGVTLLVVADLLGKGLAAASSVAMVRHMLRFALYNGRSVSGPVTALNATIAENDLIDGFATLFVGRYDAQSRALTFVNAGQDAGLILRAATGEIEALPPTGPVLGAFAAAVYAEVTVTLEEDDVLALYTDGLTEAGPIRTALLTGDGVADLLKQQAGITDPREIVARLMSGVDAHAGTGMRDDQCLLVGVVSKL